MKLFGIKTNQVDHCEMLPANNNNKDAWGQAYPKREPIAIARERNVDNHQSQICIDNQWDHDRIDRIERWLTDARWHHCQRTTNQPPVNCDVAATGKPFGTSLNNGNQDNLLKVNRNHGNEVSPVSEDAAIGSSDWSSETFDLEGMQSSSSDTNSTDFTPFEFASHHVKQHPFRQSPRGGRTDHSSQRMHNHVAIPYQPATSDTQPLGRNAANPISGPHIARIFISHGQASEVQPTRVITDQKTRGRYSRVAGHGKEVQPPIIVGGHRTNVQYSSAAHGWRTELPHSVGTDHTTNALTWRTVRRGREMQPPRVVCDRRTHVQNSGAAERAREVQPPRVVADYETHVRYPSEYDYEGAGKQPNVVGEYSTQFLTSNADHHYENVQPPVAVANGGRQRRPNEQSRSYSHDLTRQERRALQQMTSSNNILDIYWRPPEPTPDVASDRMRQSGHPTRPVIPNDSRTHRHGNRMRSSSPSYDAPKKSSERRSSRQRHVTKISVTHDENDQYPVAFADTLQRGPARATDADQRPIQRNGTLTISFNRKHVLHSPVKTHDARMDETTVTHVLSNGTDNDVIDRNDKEGYRREELSSPSATVSSTVVHQHHPVPDAANDNNVTPRVADTTDSLCHRVDSQRSSFAISHTESTTQCGGNTNEDVTRTSFKTDDSRRNPAENDNSDDITGLNSVLSNEGRRGIGLADDPTELLSVQESIEGYSLLVPTSERDDLDLPTTCTKAVFADDVVSNFSAPVGPGHCGLLYVSSAVLTLKSPTPTSSARCRVVSILRPYPQNKPKDDKQ